MVTQPFQPAVANQKRGDLIFHRGTQWDRLAIGTAGQFLYVASGLPSWRTLVAGDIPAHNVTGAQHGDAATATVARGDILYGNSTPKWDRLAKPSTPALLYNDATDVSWNTAAWTSVAYAAGNFTANLGATWTVASGDQSVFAYLLLGKMMWVNLVIQTSSISVANPTILTVPIPASKTAAKTVYNLCYLLDNSARTTGYLQATGTSINISRTDVAAFATATDTTWVLGQIFLETT